MKNDELKKILDSHSLWLRTRGAEGKHANLSGANLSGADLTGTILEKKNTSASPSFSEELQAKISEIENLLDKHGMKLASPISILPK